MVLVSEEHIVYTLEELRQAGLENSERVVLWLGKRDSSGIVKVEEVFVPIQYAEADFFRIPREGMAQLLHHLRQTRHFIAAQVHSHPRRAFHSPTDDEWAIVRHAGALSLVIPEFASYTTLSSFEEDAAVFILSSDNEWLGISPHNTRKHYRIIV